MAVRTPPQEVAEVVRAAVQPDCGSHRRAAVTAPARSPTADLSDVVLIRLHELTGVTVDPDAPDRPRPGRHAVAAGRRRGRSRTGWPRCTAVRGDVAVAGYALGGGLSWYARQHGLAAHSITGGGGRRWPTAAWCVPTRLRPDLFWACEAAAATSVSSPRWSCVCCPIADVYAGMLLWPGERARRRGAGLGRLDPHRSDTVTTSLRLMSFPPLPELPPFLSGRGSSWSTARCSSPTSERPRSCARCATLAPEMDTMARLPAARSPASTWIPRVRHPACPASIVLDELPAGGGRRSAGRRWDPESGTSLLVAEFRHLGGALDRPADAALASLPGRYLGFFLAIAPVPAAAEAGQRDATRAVAELARWSTGGRYLNFDDNVVEVSAAYPPAAWQRLQQIRTLVDPEQRLVANHPI